MGAGSSIVAGGRIAATTVPHEDYPAAVGEPLLMLIVLTHIVEVG
jgi:hypothetical protein